VTEAIGRVFPTPILGGLISDKCYLQAQGAREVKTPKRPRDTNQLAKQGWQARLL